MVLLYLGISLLISELSFLEMIIEISWVVVKFSFVMAIMKIYTAGKFSGKIFEALRSIWVIFNKPWRRVEDWFLFMEMIFRIYPALQQEWNRYNTLQNALGLRKVSGKLQHWKYIASQLPVMVVLHLQKADDIAQAMILRGYGMNIPRGVGHFIPFNFLHLGGLVLIAFLFLFFQIDTI